MTGDSRQSMRTSSAASANSGCESRRKELGTQIGLEARGALSKLDVVQAGDRTGGCIYHNRQSG